jgi:hypothetical protein
MGGDWSASALLIPSEDSLAKPSFGRTEEELERIHSYRKALRDLRRKGAAKKDKLSASEDTGNADKDDEAGGGKRKKKKMRKKKGQVDKDDKDGKAK